MQTTVKGLVIGEKILSNDNRLITILTEEQGLVRAFVKSIKKLGGSMAVSTDLFTYSSFVLFFNKEKYSVNSAEPLHIFYRLREDLEKTALASYLAQLAEQLCPEGEEAGEYLQLFLNCLHLLETDKRSPEFIKPVFELRMLTMSGYMPDLVGCQQCGEYQAESFCFSPSTGALICGRCSGGAVPQGTVRLGPAQLAAMRHIIYSENKRIFGFKMSAEGLEYLGRISEWYLLTQLEKSFPSLDFYHRLHGFGRTVQSAQTDTMQT